MSELLQQHLKETFSWACSRSLRHLFGDRKSIWSWMWSAFVGPIVCVGAQKCWLNKGGTPPKVNSFLFLASRRSFWMTRMYKPVFRQPQCRRCSSRTRWGRRPRGTGPCWTRWGDTSSRKLHRRRSPASSGWLPFLHGRKTTESCQRHVALFTGRP